MVRSFRIVLWLVIIAFLGIAPFSDLGVKSHADTFVKDMLLTLARPGEFPEPAARWSEEIRRLLSGRSLPPEVEARKPQSQVAMFPFRESYLNPDRDEYSNQDRGDDFELAPGSHSLDLLRESWVRVASLGPGSYVAVRRDGGRILDSISDVEGLGRLVGESTRVYSRLEIQVDKSKFTLKLLGFDRKGDKKQLFECRTGIGSAEYPTPTGSFYIVRIFDDNPLWIPPDKPWAWGEVPSHAAYGGYMMPLFNKRPLSAGKGSEVIDELDVVDGKMEFVDSGGYRIHGTNSPWSVGSGQSHGCVRLLNSSVKQLSDLLKIYAGTGSRGKSPNGPYVNLVRPVRMTLYH